MNSKDEKEKTEIQQLRFELEQLRNAHINRVKESMELQVKFETFLKTFRKVHDFVEGIRLFITIARQKKSWDVTNDEIIQFQEKMVKLAQDIQKDREFINKEEAKENEKEQPKSN